jgi:aromatic-L-amino-acid/L-tryptophan decarboxylase
MNVSIPLDISPEDMRRMGREVLEQVVLHVASLEEQGVSGVQDSTDEQALALSEEPPESGAPLQELLDPLFRDWLLQSYNTASPGYMAYVPGGGLYASALADFIANSANRYTGVWTAAPMLLQLEANVLRWFCDWMQLPETAAGLLTTGGSLANFGAVVAAREKHLGVQLRRGVLYASTQVHHCVQKAAKLAGILPDRVRAVAVDAALRMDTDALCQSIAADRAAGLLPFMVVSTAGTTNTGAMDPLGTIGTICRDEGLWHHVDAAYGGFFHLCPELRPSFKGLSEADSIVLDPHKGLFLPYGTGALLVRRKADLQAAHEATAAYLPPLPSEQAFNPCQLGPELSRDYRGLRVWLPLKLHGVAAFREALRQKRAGALCAYEALRKHQHIKTLGPPALSLFAFHVTWEGASLADENQATEALIGAVLQRGRTMLSGTTVGERFFARICVLSFRTMEHHIEACVDDIASSLASLLPHRSS